MDTLVTAFASLALLHNLLLMQGIGLSAAVASGGRLDTASAHAALTLLSVVPLAVLAWAVDHWLLQGAQATSLRLLLWVPASLGASALGQRWLARRSLLLAQRLSSPALRAATLLLHLVVLWWVVTDSASWLRAALDALALAVGYAVATVLLAALHGRLASTGLPKVLSPVAALVLSAAIASMALLGLSGGA